MNQRQVDQQRSSSATESMNAKIINKQHNETDKSSPFRIVKIQPKKLFGVLQQLDGPHSASQTQPQVQTNQKHIINQLNLEADDFRKHYSYVDKEKLFIDLQNTKMELNSARDEISKLKTRIIHTEKEVVRYEKLVQDLNGRTYGHPNKINPDQMQKPQILIMSLKKQLKEVQSELKDKTKEVDQIKRNTKVTRMSELEMEKKTYYEETQRLKHMVEQAFLQLQTMTAKIQIADQTESELLKAQKTVERLQGECQNIKGSYQQSEEMIQQLVHLYKQSQQKYQSLAANHQNLQQKYKRLIHKQDLKQTVKSDGPPQSIPKYSSKTTVKNKPTQQVSNESMQKKITPTKNINKASLQKTKQNFYSKPENRRWEDDNHQGIIQHELQEDSDRGNYQDYTIERNELDNYQQKYVNENSRIQEESENEDHEIVFNNEGQEMVYQDDDEEQYQDQEQEQYQDQDQYQYQEQENNIQPSQEIYQHQVQETLAQDDKLYRELDDEGVDGEYEEYDPDAPDENDNGGPQYEDEAQDLDEQEYEQQGQDLEKDQQQDQDIEYGEEYEDQQNQEYEQEQEQDQEDLHTYKAEVEEPQEDEYIEQDSNKMLYQMKVETQYRKAKGEEDEEDQEYLNEVFDT